jgi:uncharacterized lipoprotein YbaY
MSGKTACVQGEIVFDEDTRSFDGATAYVRLEAITRADASATVVSQQVIHRVAHHRGDTTPVTFALPAPEEVNERAGYSVRVHVDVDGDRRVSRGDFISMESHPVLTLGRPDRVTVRVREVKQ